MFGFNQQSRIIAIISAALRGSVFFGATVFYTEIYYNIEYAQLNNCINETTIV